MAKTLRLSAAAVLVGAVFLGREASAEVEVAINKVSTTGIGASVGTIQLEDSKDGLLIKPRVMSLPPGVHGFHLHENADCGPKDKDGKPEVAGAAGAHYDPDHAGKHEGPQGKGHLGDLPALVIGPDGVNTDTQLLAPRLKLSQVRGLALVIHEGGDNYSSTPDPLGGGGSRIACGAVKQGDAVKKGEK